MRLTVIGCSGSFPGPQSPASSYLVQARDAGGRDWSVLLDLGSGALGALQRHLDPRDLDAIALSHLHPDHVADMSGLYVYHRYHPQVTAGQVEQRMLPVFGPAGTQQRLAQAYGLDPEESMCSVFEFRDWDTGQEYGIGPLKISVFAVRHPVEAYAIRITGPSEHEGALPVTLTYSGDTDTCSGLVEAARDTDAFLCEAAFVEGRDDHLDGIHLTGKRAGEMASQASAGQLLLTHIPAWNAPQVALQEAQQVYSGPVLTVQDGHTYTF